MRNVASGQRFLRRGRHAAPVTAAMAILVMLLLASTPAALAADPSPSTACSAAAGADPQAALDAMPDGGTLCLAGQQLDAGLVIDNRHNVAIDGQGGRLTSSGCGIDAGVIVIRGASSGITIRNVTLAGTNADAGTPAAYHRGCEDQGGVMVYGSSNVDVGDVTIERTNGECLYVDAGSGAAGPASGPWSDAITFHDSTCRLTGRMGVAVAGGSNVTVSRVSFSDIAISVLDLEPYAPTGGATNITLEDSTIDRYGLTGVYTAWLLEASAMNGLTTTSVSDVVVRDNTITAGPQTPVAANRVTDAGLTVRVRTPGYDRISILDNVSTAAGSGPSLFFEHVDGVTVRGNSQPLTGGSLVWTSDSMQVTVEGAGVTADGNVPLTMVLIVVLAAFTILPLIARPGGLRRLRGGASEG